MNIGLCGVRNVLKLHVVKPEAFFSLSLSVSVARYVVVFQHN